MLFQVRGMISFSFGRKWILRTRVNHWDSKWDIDTCKNYRLVHSELADFAASILDWAKTSNQPISIVFHSIGQHRCVKRLKS